MLPVSDDYKQAIAAPRRRILGRVSINYSDPFLDPSVTVDCNEQAYNCWPQQVADSSPETSHKWASLDGSWVLGEYCLCPDTEQDAINYQMGWWGSSLSKPDCTFDEPYPTIGVNFSTRRVVRVGVIGDTERNEYPTVFDVVAYSGADPVKTLTFTNQNKVNWQQEIDPLHDITRLELVIKKWSHPGRQAKIVEFFAILEIIYEGDDLLNISLLEEREYSDGALSVGNIAAAEVNVKVSNLDRDFDVDNEDSLLHGLVKPNRKIKPYLGVELPSGSIEWQPLGIFWSNDWSVPGQDVYAETSGFDIINLLGMRTLKAPVYQNITIYDLAVNILDSTEFNYWVDPYLKNIVIPYAWFDAITHREALRLLAEASLSSVYADRDGTIRIEGPHYLTNKESVLTITKDRYYHKNNPANYGQVVNVIGVTATPLKPGSTTEVYRSDTPETVNGTKTVTINYNKKPVISAAASLESASSGVSISNVNYYAWGADVTLTGNGTCIIVVNGKPLEDQGSQVITVKDENSIIEFGELTYTFEENQLIQSPQLAKIIAVKCLMPAKEARRDLTLDWHGDPALQLGDIIATPTDFYVTSQTLDYDGGLRVETAGKKTWMSGGIDPLTDTLFTFNNTLVSTQGLKPSSGHVATLLPEGGVAVTEATTNLIPIARQKFEGWTAYSGAQATVTQNISVPEWGTQEATRIQITGGTRQTKYFYTIKAPSVDGQDYSLSVKIKNIGLNPVRVFDNLGKSTVVDPGQIEYVKITSIGNGTANFLCSFRTEEVSHSLDFIVYQPMAEEEPFCSPFTETTRPAGILPYNSLAPQLNQQQFTFACWWRPYTEKGLSSSIQDRFFQIDNGKITSGNRIWLARVYNSAGLMFGVPNADGSGSQQYTFTPSTYAAYEWQFVAAVLDVENMKVRIHLNDEYEEFTLLETPAMLDLQRFYLGCVESQGQLNGELKNVLFCPSAVGTKKIQYWLQFGLYDPTEVY